MALKQYKPITPGQRYKTVSSFSEITTDKPEKKLTVGKTKTGGRGAGGRISMRRIGGGHKQKYRKIDFKRNKYNIPGIVKNIEYDPNRSARIALIYYKDGEKRFLCSPDGLVGKKYGVELKNPLPKTQVKYAVNGSLKEEYYEQCQFSMYVTSFKYWYLMSYVPLMKPIILKIERDEVYIRALAKQLDEFVKRLNEVTEKLKK